jgi:hypothetical protein
LGTCCYCPSSYVEQGHVIEESISIEHLNMDTGTHNISCTSWPNGPTPIFLEVKHGGKKMQICADYTIGPYLRWS